VRSARNIWFCENNIHTRIMNVIVKNALNLVFQILGENPDTQLDSWYDYR